jgi:hypothetical protein
MTGEIIPLELGKVAKQLGVASQGGFGGETLARALAALQRELARQGERYRFAPHAAAST